MTRRHYVRLGLLALFAALLLAACAQATPAPTPRPQPVTFVATWTPTHTPPPQPVSVVIVTATFTPTPTPTGSPTPTFTPLPRELQTDVEGMEGWSWVYGRNGFLSFNVDFLYRALFHSAAWEMAAGPLLRSRILPNCSFYFYDIPSSGYAIPQRSLAGARDLVPPADMASTLERFEMVPFSVFVGDENDPAFASATMNCQRAGQAVLDSIELAPPSPGFLATPTPAPQILARVDWRDPAWNVWSISPLGGPQERLELYFLTDEWRLNADTGRLEYKLLEGCDMQLVDSQYADDRTTLYTPEPPMPQDFQTIYAIASHYYGNSDEDAEACMVAAQRVANNAHWTDDIYAQPLNR